MGQESRHGLAGSSAMLQSRCWPWLGSHLEAPLERVHSQAAWDFGRIHLLWNLGVSLAQNQKWRERDSRKIAVSCDQHIPSPLPYPTGQKKDTGPAHHWGEGPPRYGGHVSACSLQGGDINRNLVIGFVRMKQICTYKVFGIVSGTWQVPSKSFLFMRPVSGGGGWVGLNEWAMFKIHNWDDSSLASCMQGLFPQWLSVSGC